MIKVVDLHKKFGLLHVLKGVNLEVKKGEVWVIIGPSGSGKSTLLRSINLLEEPTSGKIFIDDLEITSKKVNKDRIRQRIGMVFQSFVRNCQELLLQTDPVLDVSRFGVPFFNEHLAKLFPGERLLPQRTSAPAVDGSEKGTILAA